MTLTEVIQKIEKIDQEIGSSIVILGDPSVKLLREAKVKLQEASDLIELYLKKMN